MSVSNPSPATIAVATHLSAHPDTTITQIADDLGLGRSTVSKALVALEQTGNAIRVKGEHGGNKITGDTWRATPPAATTTEPVPDEPVPPEANLPTETEPPGPQRLDARTNTSAEPEPEAEVGTGDLGSPEEPAPAPKGHTERGHIGEPDPVETETVPLTKTSGSGQRLKGGELHEAVTAYFIDHPDVAVTAGDVARFLDRSAGAVHNAIQKLITQGTVQLVNDKPRRYTTVPPPQ